MNSGELLSIAVITVEDKKAEDIVSLNMQDVSDMAGYLVAYHDNNERQVQSIVKIAEEKMHENSIEAKRMEGYQSAGWILTDLADIVVHIFHKDERNHYDIEKLYQDVLIESYNQVAY